MKNKRSVLFVDDDKTFSKIMKRELSRMGYSVSCTDRGESALVELEKHAFDMIILDIKMPGMGGLETLKEIKKTYSEIEVIMLTGRATVENAVESMRIGAYDYITKPCRLNELDILLKKAYDKRQLSRENVSLRRLTTYKGQGEVMLSQSKKMNTVFGLIDRVARTNSTVMILGESGTGKELVARSIHEKSKRHRHPFVAVNCASLQDTLLESELFGHIKGAFTGAHETSPGLFEAANGGTLFLDEVGELPMGIQAKLLRVLESGEIRKLGDSKSMFVDTRIITATNKNLSSEVKKGTFRKDLFFRINIVSISLPPLRERKDDIPLLVEHFLKMHKINMVEKKVSSEVLECLMKHSWTGNIRELKNLIEHMVVLTDGEIIDVCNLPEEIRGYVKGGVHRLDDNASLSNLERQHIINTLSRLNGNKSRGAEALGISLKTLYNKLKTYDIPN